MEYIPLESFFPTDYAGEVEVVGKLFGQAAKNFLTSVNRGAIVSLFQARIGCLEHGAF
jgi:hypothetical protein